MSEGVHGAVSPRSAAKCQADTAASSLSRLCFIAQHRQSSRLLPASRTEREREANVNFFAPAGDDRKSRLRGGNLHPPSCPPRHTTTSHRLCRVSRFLVCFR